MQFQRGQKSKLSDLTPSLQLEVALDLGAPAGMSVDLACFGLDEHGKLSDDRYFIFYNQRTSPCGALVSASAGRPGAEVFRVDLSRLPATIKKLVFVATIDGEGTMSKLGPSRLAVRAPGEVAVYAFAGSEFGAEKAIMVAELYVKDIWRIAAVGQGFNGGLSAVLAHFGGEEKKPAAAPPGPAAPAAPPAPSVHRTVPMENVPPIPAPGAFGQPPGPYGQPPPPYGQPPMPQPPYGQPPMQQPPYGQPPVQQPPYGQPPQGAFGQPPGPYGQPPQQPPYGQPPQQPPYGQPPQQPPPGANPFTQPNPFAQPNPYGPPAGAPAAPVSAPPPATASAAPPGAAPKVSLGKVSLEKRGASSAVSLKKGGGVQPIHINLNWDKPEAPKGIMGFLRGTPEAADLDLGCMYRLKDGMKGVIQPLGERFGSRTHPPYIFLDKDDRSGASSDGENLYLVRPDLIDLVVVFAMIYEGSATFATVNARLNLKDEGGSEVFVPLNNPDPRNTFCAVATIRSDGSSLRITKEERYFFGHKECDEVYGFGFRWVAGSK